MSWGTRAWEPALPRARGRVMACSFTFFNTLLAQNLLLWVTGASMLEYTPSLGRSGKTGSPSQ